MVLNGWLRSSCVRSSAQGSGPRRGVSFIQSVLAAVDRGMPASRLDRVGRELEIDDLIEAQLLLGRDIAVVDVVLMRPLDAVAQETFVDREDAVLGQHIDRIFDR